MASPAVVATLHHAPRTGKTLVALRAALGKLVPEKWQLFEHQREAVRFLEERGVVAPGQQPPRHSAIFFSSLAVIVQFVQTWLRGIAGVRVALVCSISEVGAEDEEKSRCGLETLQSDPRICRCTKLEELTALFLSESAEPLLVLTSYHSARKLHSALIETSSVLDLAVFDEAHNIHTPTRRFLWGGRGGGRAEEARGPEYHSEDEESEHEESEHEESEHEESEDAEGSDASGSDSEGSDASERAGSEYAGSEDERAECQRRRRRRHHEDEDDDASVPTEEGIQLLDKLYPRRLYMTGTPRDAMRHYPEVYGDEASTWHRFSYTQVLRVQCPESPIVKPFDVKIVVNGKPLGSKQSGEFFDCVAVLREITSKPRGQIRRVKVYHARAKYHRDARHDDDDVIDGGASARRSAEFFGGQPRLWSSALRHLHSRGEASWLRFKDLQIYHVHGGMSTGDVRGHLDAFNSDDLSRIHVLCSCQVFKEGVTLERCDLTVYADGKRSRRDIVQSGMRGLKAESDRPTARLGILLLVNLDALALSPPSSLRQRGDDGSGRQSVEEAVSEVIKEALRSRKKMECTAAILEALKEEDDDFADYIAELAQGARSGAGGGGGAATMRSEDGSTDAKQEKEQKEEDSGSGGGGRVSHKRLDISVAPELLRWKLRDGEMEAITARVASSTIIQLDVVKVSVDDKVTWFCAMWQTEKPKRSDRRPVLAELLAGRAPQSLGGGNFLHSIANNWSSSGKMPGTTLGDSQRTRVERLVWFPEFRKSLER